LPAAGGLATATCSASFFRSQLRFGFCIGRGVVARARFASVFGGVVAPFRGRSCSCRRGGRLAASSFGRFGFERAR